MYDKISDFNNNCTLVAVKEVTQMDDAVILEAFKRHGYVENKGMKHDAWTTAASELGMQLEVIRTELNWYADGRYGYMTLGQFIKANPVGVFFISVSRHAFVVRDGKVVDHNQRYRLGLRREVRRAKRVLNAPAIAAKETGGYVKVNIQPRFAKRVGTASWQRYLNMTLFLAHNATATPEEIFANTDYTKADFAHDIKKGLISY